MKDTTIAFIAGTLSWFALMGAGICLEHFRYWPFSFWLIMGGALNMAENYFRFYKHLNS